MLTKDDLNSIEELLRPLENRIGGVENRMGGLEKKVESVENKIDKLRKSNSSSHQRLLKRMDETDNFLDKEHVQLVRRVDTIEKVLKISQTIL